MHTCNPPPKDEPLHIDMRRKENSSPMVNNRSTTPISASASTACDIPDQPQPKRADQHTCNHKAEITAVEGGSR